MPRDYDMPLVGRRLGAKWLVLSNGHRLAEYDSQVEQWFHITHCRPPVSMREAQDAQRKRVIVESSLK